MSSERSNFLDRCIAGEVPLTAIDDAVQAWHEGDDPRELSVYLGMSDDEYWRWVRDPSELATIIAQHRQSARAGAAA